MLGSTLRVPPDPRFEILRRTCRFSVQPSGGPVIKHRSSNTYVEHGAAFASAGLEFEVRRENIREGAEWIVEADAQEVVLHLSGHMTTFESRLDGRMASTGLPDVGEIWLAPLGCVYEGRAQGGVISYAVFSLPVEHGGRIAGHQGVRDPFLFAAAMRLTECVASGSAADTLLAEQLLSVTGNHILTTYGAFGSGRARMKQRLPAPAQVRLQEFVRDNLSERLTLSLLSEVAGVPEHGFIEAFRSCFDLTPAQYVIEQRLRRAQSLLSSTAEPIAQIALATGFADHSHLTKTFKERQGMTPSAFRKRWRCL